MLSCYSVAKELNHKQQHTGTAFNFCFIKDAQSSYLPWFKKKEFSCLHLAQTEVSASHFGIFWSVTNVGCCSSQAEMYLFVAV